MTSDERGTAFEELGSHRPPSAYDDVRHVPCPHCGAGAGQFCSIEVKRMVGRKLVAEKVRRNLPCLARIKEAS